MDLEQLGKQVDESLAKETKETLIEWLYECRTNADARESNYAISDVSVSSSQIQKEHQKIINLLDELKIAADNWAKRNSH